jgi:GNAT superfamily N-acetyltransferase
MSVLIRSARPAEARVLSDLALRSKAYWGYDGEFIEACRNELTVSADKIASRRATVADKDGSIVGFTTLEGDPPEGVLGMMFVDPHVIGEGVGRLLFEHSVAAGRELGFIQLTIDADPNAEPFYRAMGAVRIGSVPSGSIPGRVLPQMVVTLKS